MGLVFRFQLLELGLLIGGEHLVDLLLPFCFRILDDLLDLFLLGIGQIKLIESGWQQVMHFSGRTARGRGVVVSPRRLQAQEGTGAKAEEGETDGSFHY